MEKIFDITLKNRNILLQIMEGTPMGQLLCIPEGFRNNIWWNMAHVVATQQILVYTLSGQPVRIPLDFVDKFKKGTVPDGTATLEEIGTVKEFLFQTLEWTREDYANGLFKNFRPYTTSVDVALNKVEDTFAFNAYHEGIHLGTIRALQKVVR